MTAPAINTIGLVAAFSTTTAFVPQLVRVLRLKSARDISLHMFLLFSFGEAMWLMYGIAHSLAACGSSQRGDARPGIGDSGAEAQI